uniref:Putative solute carrier family 26 member 10-like protein n=1 Tax=Lutzomyia longipalpis TaxID=7200 RepID=A0A1B0C9I5_LUTLO
MTVPNESTTAVKVSRPIYRLEQINQNFQYENHKENKWKSVVHKVKQIDFFRTLVSVIPILDWGRSYSAQNDLLPDFISGCTVAVMHIPQGMGYALLANVPPIMGIYTAFFPVLIYFLFGTSRHNSMGTFAVVSIMVGKLVVKYAGDANLPEDENLPTSLDVATIVTFMVGVYLLVFYIFRLGVVSTLLSDVLVSGFTTGCAIHVFTSQVKDILGLSLPQIPGYFDVVITYYEITQRISTANWVACCISGISIVVLIINNELLKPRLAKITIVPMPIELIAVVTGTLVSSQLRLAEDWGVNTIQNIPLGFPVLTPPKFALVRSIAADSFIIAIVSYTVAVSMALIFAQKFHYKIRFNQELLAMRISTANWVACCISGISIVVLIINNELLKPRLAKITIVPMPIELIAVVTGTLVSSQLRLAEDWGVNTIQNIPLGFPVLTPPKFALVRSIAADSFIIAIVSYTVAVSMALIFAQKFHYKIRFNQELLAMGIGNVFGSFFQCIPFCASLSRSVIQQTVGGRTQVASVVSCSILVFILLWVGKFFEPLPKCVLASIILVSLKGLLMQYKDFFKFWKCSRLDGFIWLTTFLTVVLVAIDVGLIVGITLSILTLLLKSLKPLNGIGNVFGSFFQCIPFCASLSRSVIQQTVGGRTQVASVVSCSILVFILLWVGKFFEPLPKCVLASIILVSLKGLLMQYKDFFKFWKCSRLDGFIWLTTFLTVVLVAIDVGLIVGITLSILTLLLKSLKPYVCLLGSVPGTEIYLDVTKYKGTVEIPNVKIFHYCGSLNFASRDQFRKLLFKHTGVNAKKIPSSDGLKDESPHDVRCIVMDFSAVTYVDSGGFTTLKAIIEELSARGILVLIAAISCPVYEGYKKSNLYDLEKEGMSKTFPTIHDAVQYALEKNIPISITYESIRL